ncbi:hypothetical protein FKG94_04820 [Exilibacterium tricleocarpae]|uniref:Uncharacterized protein n=1 Tax=Exilibacterium tricleocarpae TaxID=2591008 RepID=A0A545U3D5_9GAMM|nr:ClpX C4-type zinc finger protein [Exilibacterium tricleocarpae]TQV83995.1 hypothetical protein FKG94_04820 [Exilibacterium tricleocarpae]
MDQRLKQLLSHMDSEDARLLRTLIEGFNGGKTEEKSLAELQERLEQTRARIKVIEEKARRKMADAKANPFCHYCRVKASDVEYMFQSDTNVNICSNCVVHGYRQLRMLRRES